MKYYIFYFNNSKSFVIESDSILSAFNKLVTNISDLEKITNITVCKNNFIPFSIDYDVIELLNKFLTVIKENKKVKNEKV